MPKLHHGVGANCTILSKFIHPSEHVRTKHANLDKGHKTSVIIVGEETVKVQQKDQKCYTFRSDDYPNIVLHAVKRYLNVVNEGPPQSFFDQSTGNDATIAEAADEVARGAQIASSDKRSLPWKVEQPRQPWFDHHQTS